MKKLEEYVRSIPDFPEPGIIFRDVTTILQDADGLHLAVDSIRNMLKDVDYDVVVGPESRGFIFGVPVAYAEHKGFVPVRKKGKLPCETVSVKYALEYGTAEIEMHKDSITPGQKVVIIDDRSCPSGEEQLDLVCRLRLFVGDDAAVPDVGDACCVCATDFRRHREVVYQFL